VASMEGSSVWYVPGGRAPLLNRILQQDLAIDRSLNNISPPFCFSLFGKILSVASPLRLMVGLVLNPSRWKWKMSLNGVRDRPQPA
jgi:hypothetical protein